MPESKTCHVLKCMDLAAVSSTYDEEGEPVVYKEFCQAHALEHFIRWLMDPDFSDYENVRYNLI